MRDSEQHRHTYLLPSLLWESLAQLRMRSLDTAHAEAVLLAPLARDTCLDNSRVENMSEVGDDDGEMVNIEHWPESGRSGCGVAQASRDLEMQIDVRAKRRRMSVKVEVVRFRL